MSLNKLVLNNQIVVMRHNIRRAKVQTINKLSRRVKMMRKKFTPDELKDKHEKKIQKLIDEIFVIKKLKEDEISAFSLINTKKSNEVLGNANSSSKLRALIRLSDHKSVLPIVEIFRAKHPNWKEVVPKVLIALKSGAKIKCDQPAPIKKEVKYSGEDKRFVLGDEHNFELPENTVSSFSRVDENRDAGESLSLAEVNSCDNIEDTNGFDDEMNRDKMSESNNKGNRLSSFGAAKNSNESKCSKGNKAIRKETVGAKNILDEINTSDNKLIQLKKLVKSNSIIDVSLVKSILFSENSVSCDIPEKVISKDILGSDLCEDDLDSSQKDSFDSSQEDVSDSSQKDYSDSSHKEDSKSPQKDDSVKTKNECFSNKPVEPNQPTVVDPFFITEDDKEYLTRAPIVEASKERDFYDDSRHFSVRSQLRDSYFGLDSKHRDSRPFERKKRDGYNNFRQSFDCRKKDGYQSRFSQKRSFEPRKRFDERDNFRNNKQKFKLNKTEIDTKRSFPNNNSAISIEKLHPSWQAKKQQSTLVPFAGKKITFD